MVAVTVNIPTKAMGNEKTAGERHHSSGLLQPGSDPDHQRPADLWSTDAARYSGADRDAGATVTYTLAVLNTANI
jgi:hypothetical protein